MSQSDLAERRLADIGEADSTGRDALAFILFLWVAFVAAAGVFVWLL